VVSQRKGHITTAGCEVENAFRRPRMDNACGLSPPEKVQPAA